MRSNNFIADTGSNSHRLVSVMGLSSCDSNGFVKHGLLDRKKIISTNILKGGQELPLQILMRIDKSPTSYHWHER